MNMRVEPIAVVSVSGGKDSTATALRAIEAYGRERCRFVHADTGHEHELTEIYVRDYLPGALGVTIDIVKADFSADIARKRMYVQEKWPEKLMTGKPGKWVWGGGVDPDIEIDDEGGSQIPDEPLIPADPYSPISIGDWRWAPGVRPMTATEAGKVVERALAVLHPTGIPFLDLCLWKGRFPSRLAQFCTQELKRRPLERYMLDLMSSFSDPVESWQGVRRDESRNRRNAAAMERAAEGWTIVRPIVEWTAQQTVDYIRSCGINLNPMYSMGCGRVGCMLCINSGKIEIDNAARRWPHHVDRIRQWEHLVGQASKRGFSTLLHHADGEGGDAAHAYKHCNIDAMVDWATTTRGGNQYDLLRWPAPPMCSSSYGLCE